MHPSFNFFILKDAEAAEFVAIGGLEFRQFLQDFLPQGFLCPFLQHVLLQELVQILSSTEQEGKSKDNAWPDGFLLVEKRILRREFLLVQGEGRH